MKNFIVAVAAFLVSTSSAQSEETVVTIGTSLALSGKLAFSGLATQRGLELGIEKVNESGELGGRTLKLITEDNGGEPKLAVTGMTKLLTVDDVDIVFSSLTHITQAIRGIVQSRKKLMLYAASLADIAKENPLAFRDWGDLEQQVTALGNSMIADGRKKVALVREQSDACSVGFDILKKLLAAKNIEVAADEVFNPGETDFRGLLLRSGSREPDAFAFCAWRDAGPIMKQLSESKFMKTPTYHCLAPFLPPNDSAEIRALYEQNGAKSAWSGYLPDISIGSSTDGFRKLYLERFHEEPRAEAAFAYDDMIALGKALAACPSADDSSCVATALGKTSLDGIGGKLTFDENRLANRDTFMIEVTGGKWRRVG